MAKALFLPRETNDVASASMADLARHTAGLQSKGIEASSSGPSVLAVRCHVETVICAGRGKARGRGEDKGRGWGKGDDRDNDYS